ncbi:hypothetical protein GYMLUDRAFT_41223 [Collybiopsis luxurians FD-317 M1]|uniref:Cytochrome c oxidase assembly protein COX11 n=1 Tax=Collybiopsis luxurians FD-317 M1 TaxID=944289 RepID=A0A0D0CTZ2_9AGAR|nr:hypothetical protein GYMLUDRAFT_41223 [Collybiopsis luxurians FD-317 M1]
MLYSHLLRHQQSSLSPAFSFTVCNGVKCRRSIDLCGHSNSYWKTRGYTALILCRASPNRSIPASFLSTSQSWNKSPSWTLMQRTRWQARSIATSSDRSPSPSEPSEPSAKLPTSSSESNPASSNPDTFSTTGSSHRKRVYTGPLPLYRSREEMYAARAKKNMSLLMYTGAVIVVFLGLTYAAVPLYRLFCSATGFAGTPSTRTHGDSNSSSTPPSWLPEWFPEPLKTLLTPSSNPENDRFAPSRLVPLYPSEDNTKTRRFKVSFTSSTSQSLPWTFKPAQRGVVVVPGESSLAFYTATNNSKEDIIGVATYNVTPDRIAPYFSKIECFCFDEQKLLPNETVDMPLLFFIDKDVLDDPSCRNVEDVVLSYTFFRARRNAQGHLEPDAPEDVVQKSLGFEGYELAKKKADESMVRVDGKKA